jgi:recombination protein RecT
MTAPVDTRELSQELEQAAQPKEQKSVFDLIARMAPEIEKALPATFDATRFARIVTTEIRRTPKLLECDPYSFLGAVMLSAQLGLEPGPLNHVAFVPMGRRVEFVIMYPGEIELSYRSGQLKDVTATLVYDGDPFEVEGGTRPGIKHSISDPGEREIVAAYAVAHLKTGGTVARVIYEAEWERARKASALGAKNQGPWKDHRAAMIRKTAIRRLFPDLPKSPVWAQAVERDEQPAPDVADVIEGEAVEA